MAPAPGGTERAFGAGRIGVDRLCLENGSGHVRCGAGVSHPENCAGMRETDRWLVDAGRSDARFSVVDVVLRKLGKGARAVSGRLVRAPRKGSVVVIEFPDGMHEYVTTPVKRVLRIAGREVFYIETINSRYRLEVRSREAAAAEGTG